MVDPAAGDCRRRQRTNAVLAAVRLFIGPVGEPSWSYKNKGYGAYRRLLMAGESVAWLRLELLADGQLRASVKAHKDDRATVNAVADVPAAGLDVDRASDLFPSASSRPRSTPHTQMRDSDQEASEQAWEGVDGTRCCRAEGHQWCAGAGGSAAHRACARRRGRASCAATAWRCRWRSTATTWRACTSSGCRMRWRLPSGCASRSSPTLGRRRRIPVDGMTIHALAELIASCAWPAIARFRETRRQA